MRPRGSLGRNVSMHRSFDAPVDVTSAQKAATQTQLGVADLSRLRRLACAFGRWDGRLAPVGDLDPANWRLGTRKR